MELKKPFLCRWNFHSYIYIDPTDDEYKELCALLCKTFSTIKINESLLDKVCVRCGDIDCSMQRFISSLRSLRNVKDM